jgi:DNA polymerase III subunit delta'
MIANLIGQERASELLTRAVTLDRIAPAYLFYGASGVGRSIAAERFARMLLCQGLPSDRHPLVEQKLRSRNHPDLRWVEPTHTHKGELLTAKQARERELTLKSLPQIRIEQIRDLTEFICRHPLEASRQVVIIEEAQTMPEAAANALLKTLEEPLKATIILIAPDLDSLLPTIVSRCQRIQFYPLSVANLEIVLRQLGYTQIIEHPELSAIAQGSPGKAIAAWEQLQSIPHELLERLRIKPQNPLDAFKLAKAITDELALAAQLWLVDYLQYYYWHREGDLDLMQQWEQTRQQLLAYVQPRLVWECILLKLSLGNN